MALCSSYGGEVAIRRSLAPTGISIALAIHSFDRSYKPNCISPNHKESFSAEVYIVKKEIIMSAKHLNNRRNKGNGGYQMRNYTLGTIAMLGMAFNLLLSFSTAHAQGVADPVLYFNPIETDQDGGDKVWRNAGTAGGELQKTGDPRLEEGVIEIKAIGVKQDTK